MRLLVFSDLHRDLDGARSLVALAREADVVVGAGDFATGRRGLQPVIDALSGIERPAVLVPGNSESHEELVDACAGWPGAHVLHGAAAVVDGMTFFGLGGGVPVTPFGPWSFDLTESAAAALLQACPAGAVLVSHSPPFGHVDRNREGRHLGSRAVLAAVERARPRLVVCGHIHESWGQSSSVGAVPILNAGPAGRIVELEIHGPTPA